MKTFFKQGRVWAVSAVLFLAMVPQAHAVGLSFFGGGSYGLGDLDQSRGWSVITPRFGGDFTFGIVGPLELGPFYEMNWMNGSPGNGPLHFLGGLIRIKIPLGGLFVDGKFGIGQLTAGTFSTAWNFGFSVAVGYKLFSVGPFALAPRAGYRYVMSNGGGAMHGVDLDGVFMFSF